MMRDKLIELIKQGEVNYLKENGITMSESIADNILANGGAVFPCNAGDTVYKIMTDERIKEPYKYKVMGIWHSAVETCSWVCLTRFVRGVIEHSIKVPFSEFGKTIFLTKEDAEERQKELRDMTEKMKRVGHKCNGCEYKGEHQEMKFIPFGICLRETNLIQAEKNYNAEVCPYKE